MEKLFLKEELIRTEIDRVSKINVKVTDVLKKIMESAGTSQISTGVTMEELIRRPELSYELLKPVDEERQIKQYKKAVSQLIPEDIDYDDIPNIRIEGRQKLSKFRPETIAQASNIQGISPADIQVLMIYLKSKTV